MPQDCPLARHELYVAAATLGAHANASDGFRQRDVKFLIDLFGNWVETALQRNGLVIRNTQVARALESLVREGYARRLSRGKHPCYRLTRIGLIELLSRMVDEPQLARGNHFFFLFYFLKNYGPRLFELVQSEGKQFPYSLKLEVQRLLDVQALLKRELGFARQELGKLSQRVADAQHSRRLCLELLDRKCTLTEAVLEVQRRYPYELNSQKPLSELMASIPEASRQWELTEGARLRASEIWEPELCMIRCYIQQLELAQKGLSG